MFVSEQVPEGVVAEVVMPSNDFPSREVSFPVTVNSGEKREGVKNKNSKMELILFMSEIYTASKIKKYCDSAIVPNFNSV